MIERTIYTTKGRKVIDEAEHVGVKLDFQHGCVIHRIYLRPDGTWEKHGETGQVH